MENASKALIMAGGVLISMLVIGLVVFFFNNLSDLQNIELSAEEVEKVAEFNKQYDVYARNVYGSELLSIANKVDDYNKRETGNKGYSELKLIVKFNTTPNSELFKINKEYNYKDLLTIKKDIDKELKKYSDRTEGSQYLYKGQDGIRTRTVSQLATMRTKDIEDFFGSEEYDKVKVNLNDQIEKYNSIKNLFSEIKAEVFTYKSFTYDEYNGRVIEMRYELN